jgi:hypothetical protein
MKAERDAFVNIWHPAWIDTGMTEAELDAVYGFFERDGGGRNFAKFVHTWCDQMAKGRSFDPNAQAFMPRTHAPLATLPGFSGLGILGPQVGYPPQYPSQAHPQHQLGSSHQDCLQQQQPVFVPQACDPQHQQRSVTPPQH